MSKGWRAMVMFCIAVVVWAAAMIFIVLGDGPQRYIMMRTEADGFEVDYRSVDYGRAYYQSILAEAFKALESDRRAKTRSSEVIQGWLLATRLSLVSSNVTGGRVPDFIVLREHEVIKEPYCSLLPYLYDVRKLGGEFYATPKPLLRDKLLAAK